jgi:hypothetical protein
MITDRRRSFNRNPQVSPAKLTKVSIGPLAKIREKTSPFIPIMGERRVSASVARLP